LSAGCGLITRFHASPKVSTSRQLKEEGAQVAAELVAAVEQKPSFPSGAVGADRCDIRGLAAASDPLDAKGLARSSSEREPLRKKSARCWHHSRGLATSRRKTANLSRSGEWRSFLPLLPPSA